MKQDSRTRRLFAGRKKRLIVTAAIALVVLGGLGVYLYHPQGFQKGYDTSSPAYQRLKAAQAKPVPTDAHGLILYHGRIAEAYDGLGDTKKALESLLVADKHATEAKAGMSLNLTIAQHYKDLGDVQKAREYYQREIDRLENNEFRDDNAELIERLKTDKDKL